MVALADSNSASAGLDVHLTALCEPTVISAHHKEKPTLSALCSAQTLNGADICHKGRCVRYVPLQWLSLVYEGTDRCGEAGVLVRQSDDYGGGEWGGDGLAAVDHGG